MSDAYLPGLPLPAPAGDGVDAAYWAGLAAGELRIQRCRECGTWQVPAEWVCHRCHGQRLTFESVAPEGLVFSFARVHHPVHPALRDHVPYLTVVVELPHAGGVLIVGNLLGDPWQAMTIGEPVRGVFEHHQGATLLQWRKP